MVGNCSHWHVFINYPCFSSSCAFVQLIVEISSVSAESLNYCANSGLISELIGELTGDDVLVRYVGSEIFPSC